MGYQVARQGTHHEEDGESVAINQRLYAGDEAASHRSRVAPLEHGEVGDPQQRGGALIQLPQGARHELAHPVQSPAPRAGAQTQPTENDDSIT